MARIQIDLDKSTHSALTELAARHGHKLKPFIEYLLRMQVGELPEPFAKTANLSEIKGSKG